MSASRLRPAIVTVLGDSISAGYGLRRDDVLPVQLQRELDALGASTIVRGAGVSGDTSAQGLARMDRAVASDTDVCVVALGANDMMQFVRPEVTERNLDQIIRRAKGRGSAVVLAGMRAPPHYGLFATAFDRIFPTLARRHGTAFYPFLLDGMALMTRYTLADGMHPNANGVAVIARGLAPVVAAAATAHLAKVGEPPP